MQLRCVNHRYRKSTGNKLSLRVRGKPRQRFCQVQTPVKPSTLTALIINITAHSERYNTRTLAVTGLPFQVVNLKSGPLQKAARSGAPPG